jgi:hypothetical protein
MRAAALAALAVIVSGCAAAQNQSGASPSPAESPSPAASPLALKMTSAAFHAGEVGVEYSPVTLNATGGVTPYTWSVTTGSLPAGLSISPNGTVSGSPKTAGTFRFTLQVTDSGAGSAKAAKSVGIARALKASLIAACAVQCLVETGCATVCGKFGTLSGGVGPYTYSSVGTIPPGVRLNGLNLAGTFTSVARYVQFTVNVTDSFGAHTSISPVFNVFPHLTFTGGSCKGLGTCTAQLRYSVGVSETPAVNVVSWTGDKTCAGAVPVLCPAPTFTATVAGTYVSIDLASPSSYSTGTFKLSLFDQFPCSPGVHCSATATLTVDLNG